MTQETPLTSVGLEMGKQHHDPIADAKAQEATQQFAFRTATMEDVPALQKMIGESLRALGKGYYTQEELDGSIGWLFGADTVLLRVSLLQRLLFSHSFASLCLYICKSMSRCQVHFSVGSEVRFGSLM
jgi:hypothetical protein